MDYSEWTSCEMYGHQFEDTDGRPGWRTCRDCGDTYNDHDDEDNSQNDFDEE